MDDSGDICPVLPEFADARCTHIVTLLAQGALPAAIAREMKCSLRTIWNLRNEHDLDAIAKELARTQLQANLRAMQYLLRKAVKVQGDLCDPGTDMDPPAGADRDELAAWEAGHRVRQGRDKIRQAASKEIAGWTLKAAEVAASREQRSSGDSASLTDDQLIARALSARNVGDDEGGEG